MKYVILIILICIGFQSCHNNRLTEDPLPFIAGNCISNIDTISGPIEYFSYYWQYDSLGNNGFRRLALKYLTMAKKYNVDYDFVIKNFGSGISNGKFKSNKDHLYLVYYIYNTSVMAKEYQHYKIKQLAIFQFNPDTKKMINVRLDRNG